MLELVGYQDIHLIHQSKNSLVYSAVRENDGFVVALKTPAQAIPSARKLSSISREYEILRGCSFALMPKVLELINVGPTMVLVLEYIDAPALRDFLSDAPIDADSFYLIALSVTKILTSIHRQDLIHRDLSPGNILYNPNNGLVRVIDFGSALEFPRQARAVINPHFVEGSPPYMSPEQTGRLNRGLDYRTDFYSLGAIFYRLLTGTLPYSTTDHNKMVHCHIAVQPKPPYSLVAGIPQLLSDLVLKLMSKDAADRYQSAEGIHADLLKCREIHASAEAEPLFELATNDINDRFLMPEKLYGREDEIRQLVTVCNKTVEGKGGMAFISGHSGVGKTSLMRELYKPLTEIDAYITNGKFDQYHHNIPYSALMEAFTDFIRQILAESDDKVAAWSDSIIQALGPNGRLLTDVIPDLELLIGPQPEVDELPVAEARTRFSNVFQTFLELLGESDRPLVIFLDDLQWIDGPSLALLEAMATDIGKKSMALIGAYRSNEVPKTHHLAISLTELRKSCAELQEIHLQELAPQTLIELLADTLRLPMSTLVPLNEVLLQKTKGNPLFYKTMLNNLVTDGYIEFDYSQKIWTWNQEDVASAPYADNVVDMLQALIPSLSGEQADLLGLGACLGNVFELNHLALLAEVSRAEAARGLQTAVSAGFIQPQDSDYELLMMQSSEELPGICFRFAHDRIQQAAYTLIDEPRKPGLHLKIGRMLLKELTKAESGQKLFGAVSNLNQGASLLEGDERLQVASLNLQASKKAKASAAFKDAQTYLLAAREMLEENCWETQHDLALAIYLGLAEACYLVSDFEQAEKLYGLIRTKADNNEDILTLINIQAKQYHHQGRYKEAINLEVTGLNLLGIDLPESDEKLFELFMKEGRKIAELLDGAAIESLYDRPEVDDASLTRTHEILFDLFADGYLMGRSALLACAAAISTRLSVELGTCPMTSIGYINYGTCLCAGGEYVMGYDFGRVAVKLADRYQMAALKNYTYHLFSLSINHWREPLASSYFYWREASKLALESGSPYAGWVFLQLAHVLLASGAPLDKVEKQIAESHHYLTSAGMNDIAFMLQLIVAQPVKHLRGKTNDITSLDDDTFNCAELMQQNRDALFFLSHIPYSMLRATLIGRNIQSLETMSQWMPLFQQTMQGQFIHVDCYFYFSLHLAAGCKDQPKEQQSAYLAAIDENLARFKDWADLCPSNYKHKYLLIAAERARLANDFLEAMDFYDKAIDAAYASSFLQDAAIANEIAGQFWKEAGKPHLAAPYLQQALATYSRWGATGKVVQLKQAHPELTLKSAADMNSPDNMLSSTGTSDFSAQLDLMSIIKASQAVSQHMVLDKLAEELVDLAMQNVGATKAVLLLKKDQTFVEMKRSTSSSQEKHIAQVATGEFSSELPTMIINYVIRAGENVVLDDAPSDNRFRRCDYIRTHAPKSVCCIPIIKQKEVHGVLYLENSEMSGAFHTDRLKVLKVIASQAAISLENVNIYNELDDMNKNLERKVLARTEELNEKNHELEILSTTDQLTGLYNRRSIDKTIKEEIGRSYRYKAPLSLIMVDIDRFKQINDTHGHDIGDEVLVTIATLLNKNTRITDTVGRWGGEEFLILVPQTDAEVCTLLAEKLRDALAKHIHRHVGQVTASFGVAEFGAGDSANSLVKHADQALYRAKNSGRNKVVVFEQP